MKEPRSSEIPPGLVAALQKSCFKAPEPKIQGTQSNIYEEVNDSYIYTPKYDDVLSAEPRSDFASHKPSMSSKNSTKRSDVSQMNSESQTTEPMFKGSEGSPQRLCCGACFTKERWWKLRWLTLGVIVGLITAIVAGITCTYFFAGKEVYFLVIHNFFLKVNVPDTSDTRITLIINCIFAKVLVSGIKNMNSI